MFLNHELKGLVPDSLLSDIVDFNTTAHRHSAVATNLVSRLCKVISEGQSIMPSDMREQAFITEILGNCPDCYYRPIESVAICDKCKTVRDLLA